MLVATINSSIVLISLPAIFNGIKLNPLAPGNVSYLLWMLMGYMLVTAVLVVTLGRLGDMYGRVKIYNAGFAIFTITSIILSLDPFDGGGGAFSAEQRGMALGVNIVSALAGSFIGLVLGGVLAEWDWRSIFWVNIPLGVL